MTLTNSGALFESGDVNLERGGRCVGTTITICSASNNDNTQAIGAIYPSFNAGTANFSYGLAVNSVRGRVIKQAGTFGNTNVNLCIILLMRK